jgi:hypothetical protein
MKHLSFLRAATAALVLGATASPAAFAQSTTTSTSTTTTTPAPTDSGGWHHRHHLGKVLTSAERAELKKDKEAALAANPSLQTTHDNLKAQFKSLRENKSTTTTAQWQALHAQAEAYHKQLRSAELLIDPSASSIFTKIDAAKAAHHHSST